MAKNNSKSVRLSDEVLAYIEGYRGSGFNEQFENIILDAKRSEPERKQKLAELDKQIDKSLDKFHKINSTVTQLDAYVYQALHLHKSLQSLSENISKLVDDSALPFS